jgi:hypothetical protein
VTDLETDSRADERLWLGETRRKIDGKFKAIVISTVRSRILQEDYKDGKYHPRSDTTFELWDRAHLLDSSRLCGMNIRPRLGAYGPAFFRFLGLEVEGCWWIQQREQCSWAQRTGHSDLCDIAGVQW